MDFLTDSPCINSMIIFCRKRTQNKDHMHENKIQNTDEKPYFVVTFLHNI